MSRSPTGKNKLSPQQAYLDSWKRLARMIQQGRSFSGNERNCCFLNTRDGRFADVSAVTGLDLKDDARSLALVDWDHDGDQDVWIANRTGPRVRMLRNDLPRDGHYLALRLRGDPQAGCNRDAIGSRVEIELPGGEKRIQTLHAGDSFLSQSSKWLHFGLGDHPVVRRLTIRWPNGSVEHHTNLKADHRYTIAQGDAQAVVVPDREKMPQLVPSIPKVPPLSEQARIRILQPITIENFQYTDLSGNKKSLYDRIKGPLLLNLWASWCPPCLKELKEIAEQRETLRRLGVSVLALNVEQLDPSSSVDSAALRKTLRGLNYSLPAGLASPEVLSAMAAVQSAAIYRQRQLPLPTSMLIDPARRVMVIYRGPVSVGQLFSDVGEIPLSPESIQRVALPFPGRWARQKFHDNPITITNVYLEGGYQDDARQYLKQFLVNDGKSPGDRRSLADEQIRSLQLADVHFMLGKIALSEGSLKRAAESFAESMRHNPKLIEPVIGLAWIRAAAGDAALRDGPQALELSGGASDGGKSSDPALLDVYAASLAEAGQYGEAQTAARRAIRLANGLGLGRLAEEISKRLKLYEANRPCREIPPLKLGIQR